ncbi:aspartate/glutamate racemase family protein [Pseudoalteromonas denitrificans]|uniref:Aspartate racemase n=1 Tax=Pseudoalteromonas denitrificans DSM 6059 TaxID=1123010 RepID=A0A1I1UCY3_9GAMM|nr:amino acid racemase [Pseudoalteromonas denitrificans]SFD68544.1 aspartate racemase [Pseudoalteromonas denitrificans DSM 6059]
MKTIGMLGGLSWESTALYYETINQEIKHRFGELHSARINLHSMNFAEIEILLKQKNWSSITDKLVSQALLIESSGADFLMICNNTLHHVAHEIDKAITIPLLHITDVTGAQLLKDKINCVGLLGTKQTMELGFYKDRLKDKFGLQVLTPQIKERETLQNIIFGELCIGEINESSRIKAINIINNLVKDGAQAIILGCTELPLLLQEDHTETPLYDTSQLHSHAAVSIAINRTKEVRDEAK